MSTVSDRRKAMRGAKRVCQACEVRFYDLARNPIVCPSCGAPYTPAPQPIVHAGPRAASFAGKTGWRTTPFRRPQPMLPVADPEHSVLSETVAVEDATEETATAGPEDDIVLEQEQDDGEVSGLIDHHLAEPKER